MVFQHYNESSCTEESMHNLINRVHYGEIKLLNEFFGKRNRILDVGCGVGTLSAALLRISDEVIGIDFSPSAIQVAQQNYYGVKSLKFILHDVEKEKLPFPNSNFDGILLSHVLEHISPSSLHFVLNEIERVLHQDGILVIVAPNCGPSYRRFIFLDKDFGREDKTHKCFFTMNSFRLLLAQYFHVKKIFTYPLPGLWLISLRFAKIFSLAFGNNLYAICAKKQN